MEFYLLLTFSTIIIIYLALLIWLKTKNIIFPLGVAFLYYWSLYGAWSIVVDKLGGESGMHYQNVEYKLFTIQLDNYYFNTLFLYALFIIIIELTVLLTVQRRFLKQKIEIFNYIKISHLKIQIIAFLCALMSIFIVKNELLIAAELNKSAYIIASTTQNPLYTLHQVLARASITILSIGFAIYASGTNYIFITGKRNKILFINYMLLLLSVYIFCMILGNKNELFASLIIGLLIYLNNSKNPKKLGIVIIIIIAFSFIVMINFLRGLTINDLLSIKINFVEAIKSIPSITSSNEAFGAHFSMYGTIHFDVPLTYGSSIISLLASVVPRILWTERPASIYPHYAHYVQAIPGQGYTIHHATGWYLNFGIYGVLLGAIIFGFIWAKLFNIFYKNINLKRTQFKKIFFILSIWCFTASIPNLIRGGIESYKGIMVVLLTITCIIYLSLENLRIKF